MSLTTSQIDTQFRRLYKESSTRYFDTNWSVTAINDAIEDIWDEILNVNPEYAPVKLKQLSYAVGVREYTIDSTFEQIQKIEVNDQGGPPYPTLIPITFQDISVFVFGPYALSLQGAGQGEPEAYYVRFMESGQTPIGGTALTADSWVLGLDPIPARSATNNLNVWYIGTAGTVSALDTTLPDLPPDFHDLIPRRMCVFAAAADGLPSVDFYRATYNDSLLRKLNRVYRGPEQKGEIIEVDWDG